MNITLGSTVEVVEVANGEVASATDAASDGNGSTRQEAKARANKWLGVDSVFGLHFMMAS
jgi:hypothetical protein